MEKKYIDSEKLITEIERMREINRKAIIAEHIKADIFHGRAQAINHLFEFITSLQQEQPMPDSTQLIGFWNEDKEMLKEKDFRDDPWRLAYNAFMCGFVRGVSVKKREQKCIFGNTPSEEACKYCGVVCSSRVPKVITSTSTKVSPSPDEIADKDEQIGLSIMAYLDSKIKSDKHKVCGVPLKTAREWIRKMIAYSQERPEVDYNKFEKLFYDFCERNKGHHITSHDACLWFYELGLNARKEE